ncbi:MAG: right-handed parallel beta-helix repeat-containing protein [Bacteroidota bacterium]
MLLFSQSLPPTISGTAYYVSSSAGDDNNDGLSAATAWQTPAKAQAMIPMMNPGDGILFKRGDEFYLTDRLNMTTSGSPGNPLTLAAYGTGERPIFNGGEVLSGWTPIGGNVWTTICNDCADRVTGLTINEVMQPMGRYPNLDQGQGGYLLPTNTVSSNSEITSTQLAAAPVTDWTGAELVVRKERWIIDRHEVTGQTGNKLTLNPTSIYKDNGFGYVINNNGVSGFFLQNHPGCLDEEGEWSYDKSGSQTVYLYSSTNPNTVQVEVSIAPELLRINGRDHIYIENLSFRNSLEESIAMFSCDGVDIIDCEFLNTGENAIEADDANNVLISGCVADFTNNNVIDIWDSDSVTVDQNEFRNTALHAGMGRSGDFEYQAVYVSGNHATITRNKILSVGYNGIRAAGSFATISKNLIDGAQMIADDGGAIYVYQYHLSPVLEDIVIEENIILNTIGSWYGLPKYPNNLAYGIYCDDASNHVTVQRNYIFNTSDGGIYLHNAFDIVVKHNLIENARHMFVAKNDYVENTDIRDILVSQNIFSGNTNSQAGIYLESKVGATVADAQNDVNQFGIVDTNLFVNIFRRCISNEARYKGSSDQLALENWATTTPFSDEHQFVELPQSYQYQIQNATTDLAPNGQLNTATNWTFWGGTSFDANGPINGGSLKLPAGQARTPVSLNAQAQTGEQYVVYLSTYTDTGQGGGQLKIHLKNTTMNSKITNEHVIFTAEGLEEHQVILTVKEDDNGTSPQMFVTADNQPVQVWIDEISIYKAASLYDNSQDLKKVLYNHSDTSLTVSLTGNWLDLIGNTVSGQIVLPPWSGNVLVKKTDNGPLSLSEDLVSFDVRKVDGRFTEVSWAMQEEREAYRYRVEHSLDGRLFRTISPEIETKQLFQDNQYQFVHQHPLQGKNFYRLKQLWPDGTIELSDVREVSFEAIRLAPAQIVYADYQLSVIPNPSVPLKSGFVSSLDGKILWEAGPPSLQSPFSISTQGWTPGYYFLQLVDEYGLPQTAFRFTVE